MKRTESFVSKTTDAPQANPERFVSRGGDKLDAALAHFGVSPQGRVCADWGSHVGGFVDCLLRRGAARVYSVDTSYGVLAWRLRKDPRVVVLERTNALHVEIAEAVDLITIDVGWTPQRRILASAGRLVGPEALVLTLIKPHYEARPEELRRGVLPDAVAEAVFARVADSLAAIGWRIQGTCRSPLRGHGGNTEFFALLSATHLPADTITNSESVCLGDRFPSEASAPPVCCGPVVGPHRFVS